MFSDASQRLLEEKAGRPFPAFGSDELIAALDADGIERAAVLSVAYFFAAERPDAQKHDAEAVSLENDWVGSQVERYHERLVGFCSVNPLDETATDEVLRCGATGTFVGLKLHLANSDVDLRSHADLDAVAAVFAAAQEVGFAVVIHMRTRRPDYGRIDAERFAHHVLQPADPTSLQIAHLGGWGGYDDATDAAFGALIEHTTGDVRYDVSAVVFQQPRLSQLRLSRLRERITTAGVDRIIFGTDWPEWTPGRYVEDLQANGFTSDELKAMYTNLAPWIAR